MKSAIGRVLAIVSALSFVSATELHAQHVWRWSGQIGAASEGVSKNVAETAGRAQIRGSVEAAYGPVFIGASLRNLHEGPDVDSQQEYVLGTRGKMSGFDLSFSGGYKIKGNAPPGFDSKFVEFEATVARTLPSGTTLRLTDVYTADAPGPAKQDNYLEFGVAQALTKRWSVSGAVALRKITPKSDYSGMNIGVSYTLKPTTSIDLRYYDTNQHDFGDDFKSRLVLAITQGF